MKTCSECGQKIEKHRKCIRCNLFMHIEPKTWRYCWRCVKEMRETLRLCYHGPCQALATEPVGMDWYCASCAQDGGKENYGRVRGVKAG